MARADGTIWIDTKIDESGFEKGASGLARKATSAGDALTVGLTLPIIAVGGAAIKASIDFNRGMANVASLIPGNTQRVEELKTTVQEMAVEFGKSTDDLSEGLYSVISAFGDTADTAAILEQNVKAATAGVATTTDAINLTSAVTKAYGDTSKEAVGKVSDLALLAVRLGQTTFPELAASIGRVTPLTNELGVSQEELFGVMATLTGVTGAAAEVSTQLRGALQAMLSPTADAAKAIKDAGFESGKALIEQRGLAGAVEFLTEAAEKSGKPLQSFIGSIEGQTLALALTGTQAETYAQKLGEMEKAAGTTDAAFKEQTEGINEAGFAMQQAQAKATVMAQKLGDGLSPALLEVLQMVEPLIDKLIIMAMDFADADDETRKHIITQIALVAALGPTLKIVGMLAGAVSAMSSAIRTLRAIQFGAIISSQFQTIALKALYAGDAIQVMGIKGLAARAGLIGLAAGAGYLIGNLYMTEERVGAVNDILDDWNDGIDENNQSLMDQANQVGWITLGLTKLADWYYKTAGAIDQVDLRTAKTANTMDRHGNIINKNIYASSQYNMRLQQTKDALLQLRDTTDMAARSDLNHEQAKLRLERAQAAYTEAIKTYGPESLEAREAALMLKDAELGLSEAANRAEESVLDLIRAQAQFRPPGNDANEWIRYYQRIGDAAGEAAARANAANTAIRGGRATASTGGRQIPVYGSGGFVNSQHLAIVGDTPEVILPLGDQEAARKWLPMLLQSLPSGSVSGMVSGMRSSMTGDVSRVSGLGGVNIGAGAVQVTVHASPGTTVSDARNAGEAAARAFITRIAREGMAM